MCRTEGIEMNFVMDIKSYVCMNKLFMFSYVVKKLYISIVNYFKLQTESKN